MIYNEHSSSVSIENHYRYGVKCVNYVHFDTEPHGRSRVTSYNTFVDVLLTSWYSCVRS